MLQMIRSLYILARIIVNIKNIRHVTAEILQEAAAAAQKHLPLWVFWPSFFPPLAPFPPSQSCNSHILLIQLPGEAASTLSCFAPCFGPSLCCLSACHSCLGSLFLPAVSAKYKRIAAVVSVSPLRRSPPHRHIYYEQKSSCGSGRRSDSVSCVSWAVLDHKACFSLLIVDAGLGSDLFSSVVLSVFSSSVLK